MTARFATHSETSSWSSTPFRHPQWESLTLFGQVYVGSVTTTTGFVGLWAYRLGDLTGTAVMAAVWAICMMLLRSSSCYRPTPPTAPETTTIRRPGSSLCRRHTGPGRPARPASHEGQP